MQRPAKQTEKPDLSDRLVSVLIAVFFALPTAGILWFWLNGELATVNVFISSRLLWWVIIVFVIIAFLMPRLFTEILAAIWRGMANMLKWF